MFIDLSVYTGLFFASFIAATLLPMQSELLLAGLLATKAQPAGILIAVATAGNVAGSLVNWVLGRFIERWRDKKWFPVSMQKMQQAENWYRRYGRLSLLLSWAPVVGDSLTLVAGVLREPLPSF